MVFQIDGPGYRRRCDEGVETRVCLNVVMRLGEALKVQIYIQAQQNPYLNACLRCVYRGMLTDQKTRFAFFP